MPPRRMQDSFVCELTDRCNHACLHCYNGRVKPADGPGTDPDMAHTLRILAAMLDQTGASHVTLTGGEPMLRPDLAAIVAWLRERGAAVNLITNGSLLDDAATAALAPLGISVYEIPLLAASRAAHDRLSGRAGAFERATRAIANLKAAGQRVVAVFVATRLNLSDWRRTADLAFAFGVDGIMFNRFNPGGRGAEHIGLLQATPDALASALDIAEAVGREYGLPVSCSIAMPPCLFERKRWPTLGFGYCAAASERAYYTVGPTGDLRPCNHSPRVLGNILERGFWDMADGASMREFVAARPAFCAGCRVEDECLGGCKAAAEACSGCVSDLDPFLRAFQDAAVREVTPLPAIAVKLRASNEKWTHMDKQDEQDKP